MRKLLVDYIRTRQYLWYGVALYIVIVLGSVAAFTDRTPARFISVSSILFLIATRFIIREPNRARWWLLLFPAVSALPMAVMAGIGINRIAGQLYAAALLDNGIVAFGLVALLDIAGWVTGRLTKLVSQLNEQRRSASSGEISQIGESHAEA